MDYNLSPPWTLFNMAMALNLRLLIIPPEQSTIEKGKAILMVNNRVTYQRQSWIPDGPAGEQAVCIPGASDENHLVPAIIEEHKLYFNPHIISLMFTWDPEDCIYWHIHQADRPNACNVNRGVQCIKGTHHFVSNAHISSCATHWMASRSINLDMQHGGDLLKRQKCLRTYCRGSYSQPDLKMPCQLSAK